MRAKRTAERVKGILDAIGVGGERLEMCNLSAAMGPRFVEIATEMTERILTLGPSPVRAGRRLAGAAARAGAS